MNDINIRRIERKARSFSGRPCLYCIYFSHGVIKVGKSLKILARLTAIRNHGLMDDLIIDAVFCEVDRDASLSKAESLALRAFSEVAQQKAPEVFSSIDKKQAESILAHAAAEAPRKRSVPGSKSYHEIAKSTGMYRAMLAVALDRAREMGLDKRAVEINEMLRTFSDDDIGNYMQSLNVIPA